MAIFGIYAKFASQRNDCCLKWTLLDPFCDQKEVRKRAPTVQKVQNNRELLVSEALVAIFGICAKFASQRNGCCLKRTLLDPFCDQKGVTKRVPTVQKRPKQGISLGFRGSRGQFRNLREICPQHASGHKAQADLVCVCTLHT